MPFTRFARVVLSASVVGLLAGAAAAQEPTTAQRKQDYGAWTMLCENPPGSSVEQCALSQFAIDEQRPEIGMAISVLKTADRKERLMRLLVPLGVWLYDGIELNVDGNVIGRTYFSRCLADGCNADVKLDDDLLKIFRAGSLAVFSFKQSPEEQNRLGIPIELTGFAEGYDALP